MDAQDGSAPFPPSSWLESSNGLHLTLGGHLWESISQGLTHYHHQQSCITTTLANMATHLVLVKDDKVLTGESGRGGKGFGSSLFGGFVLSLTKGD